MLAAGREEVGLDTRAGSILMERMKLLCCWPIYVIMLLMFINMCTLYCTSGLK